MIRFPCPLYLSVVLLSCVTWQVFCGTVYKTVLNEGYGSVPVVNQTVIVHYTGTLQTGQKFDSSHDRNEPFKFKLGVGEVIRGWDAGVSSMRVGERARLEIAPEDAYGAEGLPPVIPPSAKLVFDIELLGIEGVDTQGMNSGITNTNQIEPQQTNQPSQVFQNFQGFSQPNGLENRAAINNQIFTPPQPQPGNIQEQRFTDRILPQDQINRPSQQVPGNQFRGVQNQGFGSNQPQREMSINSNQMLNNNLFGNTQGIQNQLTQQSGNLGLQTQQMQTDQQVNRQTPFASFPNPSQDISRMNPVLSQVGQNQNNIQTFQPSSGLQNQQPIGIQTQRSEPMRPQGQIDRQQIQGDLFFQPPRGSSTENNNNFPTSRFEPEIRNGAMVGQTTRNRVPDLNAVNRLSVDLRPRMSAMPLPPPQQPDPLPPSRDRLQAQSVAPTGIQSSQFGRFDDRQMTNTRFNPDRSSGFESFQPPETPFPDRNFRTGSRNLGRTMPDGFRDMGRMSDGFRSDMGRGVPDSFRNMGRSVPNNFRPRGRSFRDSRLRDPAFDRFSDFDPRFSRGMDFPSRFRRDRFPLDRARRGRFRRPF